ncbi:protein obstructor-E-like [Artemia franciscana]|uniref:protein obstructor-E-like n=1 Tax=Artemia franciscana TaxID=6661 RepID=UPI0032DB7967
MMLKLLTILLACVVAIVKTAVPCEPSKFPYKVADSSQCDKYIKCHNQQATEELCEDGYVFEESIQNCDLPFKVDCTSRPTLQPPRAVGNCSRLNGIFPSNKCDEYLYCQNGEEKNIKCDLGLVFDPKQGVCEFPDIARRPGCQSEDILNFRCPIKPEDEEYRFDDHERHPHPKDCRYYFKCMRNGMPRLGGCKTTEVYNPEIGVCDLAKNVKGCENYYKDV